MHLCKPAAWSTTTAPIAGAMHRPAIKTYSETAAIAGARLRFAPADTLGRFLVRRLR